MPGTILVSVLEFMDLPSSSSSSSISIKVSLGPRSEFQIWESRDLSFPLTTLRDNMLVILQDSEGNQISETAIETRSIVEKGLWDDFFPLKGGGFLHMKMHFVLTEEERNQIRMMRESAVKKKHGEFIHSSVQSTPSAMTNVASSLSLRNVISDRNEETSSAITVQQSVNLSPTEFSRGGLVDNINIKPLPTMIPAKAIGADELARLLRGSQPLNGVTNLFKLHEDENSKLEKQQNPMKRTPSPHPTTNPAEAVCAEEPTRLLQGSQPVIGITNLPKLQEDENSKSEKQQSPMKRTPSVKNMISAFETGLAEDKKPHIKPSLTKVQSNRTLIGNFPKNQHLKEDKKVSTETSSETFKVPERIFDDHRHQPSKILHGKRDLGGSPVIEENHQPEISSKKSNIQGVAAQICTSIANYEDRPDTSQSSSGWIFPDEAIRFCITTSGKKVMDFLGSCNVMKPGMHQDRKSFSPPKNVADQQDNVDSSKNNEVNRHGKDQRPKELNKVQKSEETETSGMAVGQAIKVAIMIGFGTLVLLTRQRSNR